MSHRRPTPPTRPGSRSCWRGCPVVRQLRQSVGLQRGMLVVGLVLTGVFVLTAIFAPLLAPYGYAQLRDADGTVRRPAAARRQAPAGHHGRRLRRAVPGHLGRPDGAARHRRRRRAVDLPRRRCSAWSRGYFGGWLDRVLVVVADAIYAFPSLLLAIVMAIVISGGQSSLLGRHHGRGHLDHRGVHPAVLPGDPRRDRPDQGRAVRRVGQGHRRVAAARIMVRHVLRNATRTLPLIFTLNASEAILTLAGLGFLGFGIEPTLGRRVGLRPEQGRWPTSPAASGGPASSPGSPSCSTVLGLTLVGESLNDLADPRLRGRTRGRRRPPTAGRDAVDPADLTQARWTDRPGDATTDRRSTRPSRRRHRRPPGHLRHRRRRRSTPSTDVSLRSRAGEVLAIVGESRQRQDRDRQHASSGCCRRPPPARGAVLLTSKDGNDVSDVVTLRSAQLREMRGRDVAMVFQEPSTALNPVFTVGWQIAEGLRAHGEAQSKQGGPGPGDRGAAPGRHPRPRAPRQLLPAPVLRRAEAARRHRAGARPRPGLIVADEPTTALDVTVQAEILDLLRELPRRVRHRDRADHPQHGRGRRPRRPRRGDVPGRDRGAGRRPRAVRAPRRTVHPAAAGRRAARSGRDCGTRERAARRAGSATRQATPWSRPTTCAIDYPGRLRQPGFTAVDGVSFTHPARRGARAGGRVPARGKTTIGRAIAGLTRSPAAR